MNHFLPFRPIKGQPFRLYFSGVRTDTTAFAHKAPDTNTSYICKDGGSIETTINTIAYLGTTSNLTNCIQYLDLTAEEMNADVIVLNLRSFSTKEDIRAIEAIGMTIYTQPEELTSAPSKISSLEDKITALFQYFFGKRTVTATAETLYKDNGSTPLASNTLSDDGTTVTKGKLV